MSTTTTTPPRTMRIVVVLAMTAAMLAATSPTARSHGLCTRLDGAPAAIAAVLDAVNIFDSVADTSAVTCVNPFHQVVPKMQADWVGDVAADRVDGASLADRRNKSGQRHATAADCIDGMAADMFSCDNLNLLVHVSLDELGGQGTHDVGMVNDMWGWTHPHNGKDVAIVGTNAGTAFVDITLNHKPKVLGFLPTASTEGGSAWRDVKIHDNHVFVGSEHSAHGIQVFDLMRLFDGPDGYRTFDMDAHYTGVGSSHNLHVNEATGFLYVLGASPDQASNCSTGLHMVDVSDPVNPVFAGCWDGDGYVHDTQCVVYDGPDADYRDRELCFNSVPGIGDSGVEHPSVSVTDVTDKANPVRLFDNLYEDGGAFPYSHQGWLTEDLSTFYHGDELDEYVSGLSTTTRIWDVSDLDNPERLDSYVADTTSIDHNMYTEGDLMYQSNYTSGLRILDISDRANPVEVAHFDMYPENDNASFEGGTWSNYPYFSQEGIVATSSMDRGLFVFEVDLD